jgi:hypothetical protein
MSNCFAHGDVAFSGEERLFQNIPAFALLGKSETDTSEDYPRFSIRRI